MSVWADMMMRYKFSVWVAMVKNFETLAEDGREKPVDILIKNVQTPRENGRRKSEGLTISKKKLLANVKEKKPKDG